MKKQINLLNDDFKVLTLPPMTASVVVIVGFDKLYYIIFVTPSGDMILAKKTNLQEPKGFKSLDSVLKVVKELGWTGDITIRSDV